MTINSKVKAESKVKANSNEHSNQDLPEIDSVRVYQSVSFEKKPQTFFSTRSIANHPTHTITINSKYAAVEIKTDKDHVMVPFTNVSGIYFRSEIKKQSIEAARIEKEALLKNAKASKDSTNRPR